MPNTHVTKNYFTDNGKLFPIADMIPAMVLVMPMSWIWASWIQPLLA